MFNVFPASSEHLHFGWPAGTGPWSPSSGKLSTKGPSENGSAIPMSVWCRLEHPQSWDRRARGDVPFPRRHDPKMEEGWFVLPASLCDMKSGNLGAEPQCCPPQSREELTSTCWTAVRVKAGPLVAVNRSIFETC